MTDDDARAFAGRVASKRPIKLKADSIAERIGCTMAVRTLLGLTTIGACDMTRAERDKATRKRRTAAERERQHGKGVIPREQYRAKAEALRAEAAALGITYETLRKRKLRAAKAALSQVPVTRKRVLTARQALGTLTPRLDAPPFMISGLDGSIFVPPNQSGASPG